MALLDLGNGVTLFVQQEVAHIVGHHGNHLAGKVFHGFFFHQSQHRQCQRLDTADEAVPVAAWTDVLAGFVQGRAQPLTGHLQQAKTRNPPNLGAGAVQSQGLAQAVFHLALIAVVHHIDEVDHHQAAQVTDPQLPGNFVSRLKVCVEGGFLDVAALGSPGRVDVDGQHCFCLIDHDRPAGGQVDIPCKGRLDLAFDLVAGEQRRGVVVVLELAQVMGHDLLHELLGVFENRLAVDENFTNFRPQVIPQGANDQFALLVDQERGLAFRGGSLNGVPQMLQVVEVPFQLFSLAPDAGGADNESHVPRNVKLSQGILQRLAFFTLDAAGNATRPGVVRHQHQVTAGQADKGGQGRTLVAALLLFHLDHNFLALAYRILDADLAIAVTGGIAEVFG